MISPAAGTFCEIPFLNVQCVGVSIFWKFVLGVSARRKPQEFAINVSIIICEVEMMHLNEDHVIGIGLLWHAMNYVT